jgi:flagellar basal-body rod protein FlgG
MIKGLDTSATAMRLGMVRQEVNANNLANADTTGFKRDHFFVSELVRAQAETAGAPRALKAGTQLDASPGALDPTTSPLDVALQGPGFFVVNNDGRELYSRNGHFVRSADGVLLDHQGRRVQGEGGDITVPNGDVTISPTGEISVNGAAIDRLRVVNFEKSADLVKAEGSAHSAPPGSAPIPLDSATIRQGFLEKSNVDAVHEMVEMIATARNYEVNSKLVLAQDESLRHVVGELGRV